ncbi:OmpA/MotB domain protein [Rhodopseudomonas palustris TIE-1]|uniref:OmpA family protein n=1 Tax=Rhodopseudomonas palustris TaxID=1076 RepID=UPI000164A22A|nr:OmpA family protein [Rhodopseudomonas palustris]ACF03647.1 OmpA/MotB domain protein [Rhodopseudomonas palustris TIE-1]
MTWMSAARHRAKVGALILALGAAFPLGDASAGEVTSDQIVRALTPNKPLTRSLSAAQPAAATGDPTQAKFVDSLRNRPTRSLSSGERTQIAEITKDKPNIDLEITFEYNSANISRQAAAAVEALGKALSSPDLKGGTFVVAGHTDSVGSDSFNQDLSERRADTIKRVLVEKYGIAGADLVTVGYGESRLKDPAHPDSGINRRVQVVNMSDQNAAAK